MAVNNKYPVSSGDLRKKVTFQNNNLTPNGSGGSSGDNYTDLLTTRCKVMDNSGNKRLENGEIVFINSWRLICRYQAALAAGLNSDTRCIVDGQVYRITNYGLTDMTKHFYFFNLSVNG